MSDKIFTNETNTNLEQLDSTIDSISITNFLNNTVNDTTEDIQEIEDEVSDNISISNFLNNTVTEEPQEDTSVYDNISITDFMNGMDEEEITNFIELPMKEELNSQSISLDDGSINVGNAVLQGVKDSFFGHSNAAKNALSVASLTKEKFQPSFIFGEANIEDVYLPDVYQPEGINNEWESLIMELSRNFTDMGVQMLTTGAGGALGSVVPGVGNLAGAGIGLVGGAASSAFYMAVKEFRDQYDRFINEGLSTSEAFEAAYNVAGIEGVTELASDVIFAGIGKFAKLGVNASKTLATVTKLVKSGGITQTAEGLAVNKVGENIIKNFVVSAVKGSGEAIKHPLKATKKALTKLGTPGAETAVAEGTKTLGAKVLGVGKTIGKGGATEFGEEIIQGSTDVIAHRPDDQSILEALWENKEDIGKQGLFGFIGGVGGMGGALAINKGVDVATKGIREKYAYEEASKKEAFNAKASDEEEIINIIEGNTDNKPSNTGEVTPIGDSYGGEISGNQKVDNQGDTVLSPTTDEQTTNTSGESVDEELNVQNNENEDIEQSDTITTEQREQLNTTRNEIAKETDIDNNEEENTIPGSVSDNGYASSESYPVDMNGMSRKDEVPSTPSTVGNLINTHHQETQKAMDKLGINTKETAEEKNSNDTKSKTTNTVTTTGSGNTYKLVKNNKVSSIHKYYGVKNFVEKVGTSITDRSGKIYKLFVKSELSPKEKKMLGIARGVIGFVIPTKHNVIRVSNSRDYPTIIHETTHHLVSKLQLLRDELDKTDVQQELKREHRKLEKIDPFSRLNEKSYKSKSAVKSEQDRILAEEYLCNLIGAYGTGKFTPSAKVVDLINKGMEKVGVSEDFNTMRQLFIDYNTIKATPKGALKIAENNMRAGRLLQQNRFDKENLNEKELSTYKKLKRIVKDIPYYIRTRIYNENYQIEQDAKRTGNWLDVLKANQALRMSNRIKDAYLTGTGVYFENGNLHKLTNSREIKNLVKIYNELKAMGDGNVDEYAERLESLLWAKQTIGENTGNQRKAENLLKMANELGYPKWLDARRDLKILSMFFRSNLYNNINVTEEDIKNLETLLNKEKSTLVNPNNSESVSRRTEINAINTNDKELANRLNDVIWYVHRQLPVLSSNLSNDEKKRILNNFIDKNYLLDKNGSIDTGMTLEDAIQIYTDLQTDPKIQQLESLENDVRNLVNSLNDIMMSASTSSRMRILMAQEGRGAWYVPLLRFIDESEEKAKGVDLKGKPLSRIVGSNREVLPILSSLENVIETVASNVTTNQAIDYLLKLRDEPIFAEYIREIPPSSQEVEGHLLDVANYEVRYIRDKLARLKERGEKISPEYEALLNNWLGYYKQIREDIYNGRVNDDDARIKLWIETPPINIHTNQEADEVSRNVITRLEEDGKVHYYLVDDVIKDFIYNQRKNVFNISNQDQFIKDSFGWVQKLNTFFQTMGRTTYTVTNLSFQVANIFRDAYDSAYKGQEKDSYIGGALVHIKAMANVYKMFRLLGGLLSAKNREEFNTITTIFGGAEQTLYKSDNYTTSYLDFKVNKKGKIVRGGKLGWLKTIADALGNTDLLARIVAVQNRCKELGLDIHEINASYDDYVSLDLPKKVLKKYITDEQIENILGKDKADTWRAVEDDEYFPYVPEEFEKIQLDEVFSKSKPDISATYNDYLNLNLYKGELKKYITDDVMKKVLSPENFTVWENTRDDEKFSYKLSKTETDKLNELISKYKDEIDKNKFTTEVRTELQDIYDRSSIDFSRGTLTSRTLGKAFLFFNSRIQGAAQTISYSASHKKTFTGMFSSMMMLGILQTLLGWEDDEPSDDSSAITGFEIKPLGVTIPIQSIMMVPKAIGNAIGRLLKENKHNKSLTTDLSNILWDNTMGAFSNPTGIGGVLISSLPFLLTGKTLNFGDSAKYNEFNPNRIKKAGANVDTLIKKMDSLVSIGISKFLVDHGVYKYSAHEVDRFINLMFGNSVQQLDGLLGLRSMYDKKSNEISWLNWKLDPIKALTTSLTKPLKIKNLMISPDTKYIREIEDTYRSLYDRYTGQIGASADTRITPDQLSDEDRQKYQSYFDKSYFAWRANNNLQTVYNMIMEIDTDEPGGQKAYDDAVHLYKDLAHTYREFIENFESTDSEKESYKKYYGFFQDKLLDLEEPMSEATGGAIISLRKTKEPKAIFKPTQPSKFIGNVDVANRPMIKAGKGYSTTQTSVQEIPQSDGSYHLAHFATIDETGRKLDKYEISHYLRKIFDTDNPMEADKKENGGKGLLYRIDKTLNGGKITDTNIKTAISAGEKWDKNLHKYQNKLYKKYWEEHKDELR